MAVDFVSVGLLQWRDLDSDDLSLGLGCCLFFKKKIMHGVGPRVGKT
jgi:hypothetical protein